MHEKYDRLKTIYNELKTKVSVRSSKRILLKQKNLADSLINKLTGAAQIENSKENSILLEKAKKVHLAILSLVEIKSKSQVTSFKGAATALIFAIKVKNKAKMSAIELIRTIPLLIPIYQGDGEKLTSTVAALKACKSLIDNTNQAIALQVILSRLEGKARAAVGDAPQNIDEIIAKLEEKCKIKIAPETVVAKLNATKQVGEIGKFTETIEKLTLDLERAYISENVPVDTATRMSVKAGVKALAAGVKNSETRLLLKAGQFSTLTAAVEKVTENETTEKPTNSVLHFRQNSRNNPHNDGRSTNNYHRGRGNGNRPANYGRNGRYQSNDSSNYRRNNNGNGYHRQNNQNYGRNQRGRFHNQAPRVFYAQSGNQPAPQPGQVGSQGAYQGQPITQQQQTQPQGQIIHHITRQ